MRSKVKARAAEEAGELWTTPWWRKEQFSTEQHQSPAYELFKNDFQNTWESERAELERELDMPHAQGPQNTPVVDRAGRQKSARDRQEKGLRGRWKGADKRTTCLEHCRQLSPPFTHPWMPCKCKGTYAGVVGPPKIPVFRSQRVCQLWVQMKAPASVDKVERDRGHIWRQPLVSTHMSTRICRHVCSHTCKHPTNAGHVHRRKDDRRGRASIRTLTRGPFVQAEGASHLSETPLALGKWPLPLSFFLFVRKWRNACPSSSHQAFSHITRHYLRFLPTLNFPELSIFWPIFFFRGRHFQVTIGAKLFPSFCLACGELTIRQSGALLAATQSKDYHLESPSQIQISWNKS